MSFSRFGVDSDVYTFPNTGGEYECCGCPLADVDFYTPSLDAFLAHLEVHEQVGHKVPAYTASAARWWADENPDGW